MAKLDYINPNDDAFNTQLQVFKNSIPSYAAPLSITATQMTGQAADANYFDYTLKCLDITANSSQQWTAWKNLARRGGTPPLNGAPVVPVFPTLVAAVDPGIEERFRALAQRIKDNANYNESIGQALGIEGAEQTAPDLATIQPEISAIISGNHVLVKWGWGGNRSYLDMCEIQVDRNDGQGFRLLSYDTTPGYTDTAPLPAVPAMWQYRAIYRVGDSQTGQWSLPVSITVPA